MGKWSDATDRAYRQEAFAGVKAALELKMREDCPYDRRTRPGRAWVRGWKKGCQAMADAYAAHVAAEGGF